jgi:hypothetical protein
MAHTPHPRRCSLALLCVGASLIVAGCGSQQKAVAKTVSGPFIQQGTSEAELKVKTEDAEKSEKAKKYLVTLLEKVNRKAIEKAQGQDGITLSNNEVEQKKREFSEELEVSCGKTPYQGQEPYWACSYKSLSKPTRTVILKLNKATGEFSFIEEQKEESSG